jgi:hypothetical protein
MAIGRVGSFATVEPALVDFGSMAERNIDKIKSEEEAKLKAKAAEAKAKGEALKDVKDIEAFKLSGVTGYDKTLSGTVNNMYQKFLDAKESYLNTGDRSYLLIADKIRNEVDSINNESLAIGNTLTKFAELSKAEKINKDIADEKLAELQAIKDGKAEYSFEDGKTMITFKDEEGNITNKVPASGYVTNMLSDIPEPFNLESTMNETVSKVKASTSEVGNALFQRKTTDINSPESAPQRKSLQNTAEYWSNNNGAMASWYQSKRAQEKANGNVLPLKTSNWTEDERKEAQGYFYNQLKNKYAKEVTIDAQQPNKSGDGGSGDKKDVITPSSEVGVRRIYRAGDRNKPVNTGYAVGLGGKPVGLKDRTREYVEMGYDEDKKSFYVKVRDYFPQSDQRGKGPKKENGVVSYIYEKGQKPEVDKALKRIVNPNTGIEFEGAKDADDYIKSLDTYKSYLKDIESKKETPAERAARIASGK